MSSILYAVVILGLLASPVLPNSTGAPKEACNDLTPQHGVPEQTSAAPYQLIVSNGDIKSGETVKVSIKGNGPEDTLRGFLAQAKDGDGKLIGTFIPGPNTKPLTCKSDNDAITHTLISTKISEVNFSWKAPENFKGSVTFVATVAKKGDTFWVAKIQRPVNVV